MLPNSSWLPLLWPTRSTASPSARLLTRCLQCPELFMLTSIRICIRWASRLRIRNCGGARRYASKLVMPIKSCLPICFFRSKGGLLTSAWSLCRAAMLFKLKRRFHSAGGLHSTQRQGHAASHLLGNLRPFCEHTAGSCKCWIPQSDVHKRRVDCLDERTRQIGASRPPSYSRAECRPLT